MALTIQVRRGTKTQLNSVTLSAGELGYTTDTKQLFIGDGATIGSGLSPVGGVRSGSSLPSFDSNLHPIGSFFLITGSGDTGEENDLYISNGSAWVKVGVNQLSDLAGSLDDISDGSIYGKVLLTQLSSGKVNQIDDGANNVTAAQARSHIDSTSNPHSTTLEQVRSQNNQVSGQIDMNSNKIINVATPTSDNDAVNKAYADSISAGLDPKESVKAATTANITLSGTQTIDGFALSVGDRVLVKNQTTQSENGIYVVASGSWTRSDDFDGSPTHEVNGGEYVFVAEGTTNGGSGWIVINANANFTGTGGYCQIGTDIIEWAQFSSSGTVTAGAGLTKTGDTIDVNADDNSINVSGNGISVNPDDITLETDNTTGGGLQVKDGGINENKLSASVAGNGLTGGAGSPLAVGAGNGITVNANDIEVAYGSITGKVDEQVATDGVANTAARSDHTHQLDDIDCGAF